MKHILLTALAAITVASCNTKVETTETAVEIDKDKIKTEIETMEATYAKAFNAQDVEGVLAYYAENAESYETGTPPLIGKAAMRTELEKDFKELPKGLNIGFTTKDLHISNDGSQVVEIGAYSLKDSTGTEMGSGNFLALFENQNGKYLCVREMITSAEVEE